MKIELSTIIILYCLACCTVQLSSRHDQFNDYYGYQQPIYTQPTYKQAQGPSIISAIIGIVFICLCGAGCVYCYRRMNGANEIPHSPPNSQPNYNFNNRIPQPPTYSFSGNPPQQIYNQRAVGAQLPNPNSSLNPYITENTSQINKACDLCNIKSKIGEQPRILISCPSQHFFHLSCIGSSIHPPNVICPKCGQVCLSKITLYCSSCKQTNVLVDVSQFIYPTGELDIDALKAKYGDLCPKCINR